MTLSSTVVYTLVYLKHIDPQIYTAWFNRRCLMSRFLYHTLFFHDKNMKDREVTQSYTTLIIAAGLYMTD